MSNPRALLFAVLTLIVGAPAAAVDFDYAVERFSVSGNLPGARAGAVGGVLTDEFDSTSDPAWTPTPGSTVFESDGALHLASPGFLDPNAFSELNPAIVLQRSDAFAPAIFRVAPGSGDFTASSTWLGPPVGPSGFYSMGVRGFAGTDLVESISVSVRDFDAAFVQPPFAGPPGLVATFSHTFYRISTQSLTYFDSQQVALSATLGSEIRLDLVYDDGTGNASARVSTDGGATFADPFASSIYAGELMGGAPRFFLFADPIEAIPEPSTALLLTIGLLALARRPG